MILFLINNDKKMYNENYEQKNLILHNIEKLFFIVDF